MVLWRGAGSVAVVDSQFAAIGLLVLQQLHGLHGALDIDEIGMSKTSWLPRPSVDCNSYIDHVPNATKEVVEVSVGHLEGHIANEESLRWRILRFAIVLRSLGPVYVFGGECGILNDNSATFVELLMHGIDGRSGSLGRGVVNVAETRRY